MTKKSDIEIPGVVPGRAIETFLKRLEKKKEAHVEWGNEDGPEVKVADWARAELLDCVTAAAEQWERTAEAAALTEWSVDTLQQRGRAILEGKEVPAAWRGLEVRDTGAGYEFRITTIPEKKKSAA